MKNFAAVIFTLLLVNVPAMALTIVGGSESDRAAILDIKNRWQKAYEGADLNGILDLYTTDALIQMRGRPIVDGGRDPQVLRTFFAALLNRPGLKVDIREEELYFYDNNTKAHTVAKFLISMPGPDGATVYDGGRSLIMYAKGNDDRWRMWRDIDTPSPDANDLKPAAPK
jgi:ketosteroid isomerase-like protein